jgi:hypothetical protein
VYLDLLPLGAEEQPRAAEIKDDIREEYHETVRNLEQLDSSSSKKGKGGLRNEDVPGGGSRTRGRTPVLAGGRVEPAAAGPWQDTHRGDGRDGERLSRWWRATAGVRCTVHADTAVQFRKGRKAIIKASFFGGYVFQSSRVSSVDSTDTFLHSPHSTRTDVHS